MIAQLALAVTIPLLVLAAPMKGGGNTLSCVMYQFGGAFATSSESSFSLFPLILSYPVKSLSHPFQNSNLVSPGVR